MYELQLRNEVGEVIDETDLTSSQRHILAQTLRRRVNTESDQEREVIDELIELLE